MNKKILFLCISAALLLFIPIFMSPAILLERNNDLEHVFWPVFYTIQESFKNFNEIPLFNRLFFAGTPLLPDPQFSIYYLPNLIFLILPTDIAFVVYFMLHAVVGGIMFYLLSFYGFKFSRSVSLISGILYIWSPKLAGFLEAGHYSLFATHAWIPLAFLSLILITRDKRGIMAVPLAISMSSIFYLHSVIFFLVSITVGVCFFYLLTKNKANILNSLKHFVFAIVLAFGLNAPTLIPQIEWLPTSTRFLLLTNPDVYPKWTSLSEFLKLIFIPYNDITSVDSEKWIPVGLSISFLAGIGFISLKTKEKYLTLLIGVLILLLVSNNASPLYDYFISQNWYRVLRVSTRLWFIVTFISLALAANGLETISKKKLPKKIGYVLIVIALGESLFLSLSKFAYPKSSERVTIPKEIYEFLDSDKSIYRVHCTNRCIPQKKAAQQKIELLEGYNTLQQMNYYKHSWQLMGGFWNYYTLAVPPFGSYKFSQLNPHPASLGEWNVKYVISSNRINNLNLIPILEASEYTVYENTLFMPRIYFRDTNQVGNLQITHYSPNSIIVSAESANPTEIIIAEVYSKGWRAYVDEKEVPVLETPNALSQVAVPEGKHTLKFVYNPKSYLYGRIIGIIALLTTLYYLRTKWRRENS